ncbi:MAG: hypothetical protein GX933_03230 [Chloroflexi bacterium]|nr:hypothetical protein [Chloroflexota bacterium]
MSPPMPPLNQLFLQFTAATLSAPQENGRYQVIVKAASIYQGGTFVTLLDYRGGNWQLPAGYCPLQILAWKKDT